VKKALDLTGAKITVMSKAGEGTTFSVQLKITEKIYKIAEIFQN
jgi:signal transduction histidine kinase